MNISFKILSLLFFFLIGCLISAAAIPGDANNDGVLDKNDIPVIRDHILEKSTATGDPDANQDGGIDVADIISVLKQLGEEIVVTLPGDVEMVFLHIPAGSFSMGSDDNVWSDTSERPVHTVTIGYTFYMGKYEVTKGQWNALMSQTGIGAAGDDDKAVENISWDECQTYIQKMNALSQGTFRLPSESEWEYAGRGGSDKRFSFGDSDCSALTCISCDLDDHAWWCGNNDPFVTKQVGQKLQNDFGLHDMSGNVWEWCQDYWHDNYNGAFQDGSAWETPTSLFRVLRGGYWDSDPKTCRPSARYKTFPDAKDESTGLRLVLEKD